MVTRREDRNNLLKKAEEAAENAIKFPGQAEYYLNTRDSYLKMAEKRLEEVQQMMCDLIRLKGELDELSNLFGVKCFD